MLFRSLGFLNNAVALVLVLIAVHAHVDWAVYVTFFLLGMGWGGLIPLQEFIWASYFGRRHLGAIRGMGLPFALSIGATAPYLTSLYFDVVGNYDGAFLIVAGLSLLAAILQVHFAGDVAVTMVQERNELCLHMPTSLAHLPAWDGARAVRQLRLLLPRIEPFLELGRFHSPIGLELHAETPEEIALSIMAEIIMLRRGGSGERMATLGDVAKRSAGLTCRLGDMLGAGMRAGGVVGQVHGGVADILDRAGQRVG